ncbi:hypothetical protein VSH64_34505 [Amycolatopsis rhabdoformis]|uniref:Uncharacterized protein n=1 Tax=Amycolatopsis rhabdoformis TaxID=1448059 RepID=A0ABZ1I0L4_9PSEU|nr:hypothetical protein [Amycolatopsis rhabdoformis]WSE27931.1 hypothetical protein VSH64_34505 [Amycolatopsis rhabdoformis]
MADEGSASETKKDEAKKPGWGTLGHQWITAIAALVTALTGAGFFVGRASAPNPPAQPAPATVTVTATASGGDAPAPPGSAPSKAANPGAGVYSSGAVTFGSINLDLNPPAEADENDIEDHFGSDLFTIGGSRLRVWADAGVPGRDDCRRLATADGTNQLDSLHAGSVVCGITAKGRPFRLTVKVAASDGLVTDAVVWDA